MLVMMSATLSPPRRVQRLLQSFHHHFQSFQHMHRLRALQNHRHLPPRRLSTMVKLAIDSKYRMNSGHEIPVLGYGVYQTPAAEAQSVVHHALKTGYRHVDSAIAYRNEAPSVAGMNEFMKSTGTSRPELFFTSKVSPKSMSYQGAKACVDETLKATGLDYVDLYLLHSPYGGRENRLGAWQALVEAVEEGKVKSIGVSNYGVHHLDELRQHIALAEANKGVGNGGVISINQVELHPWLARKNIVDWCDKRGVLMQAYCPLVRGERAEDKVLLELAQKHGKTWAQILLRWSLQKGFIPLPKSVTLSRIEENAMLFDFELTAEDMKRLDTDDYSPVAWDPTKEPLDR